VVVSMLTLKRCLGMYKDPSCNNAFGFSGIANPPLTALPQISCVLTRHMPNPPPPTPPQTPPTPPPGFNIDPGKCNNGGHAYFIVAPHQLPSHATLQTWELNIHLNMWLEGMQVVIDFPSLRHADHALHVSAVKPPDVAKLVAVTKHSAIIELLRTAARDFQFEALGDVESLEVVCDFSNIRLFPPPPVPNLIKERKPPENEYGKTISNGRNEHKEGDQGSMSRRAPPPPITPQRPQPPLLQSPPQISSKSGPSLLTLFLLGVLVVGVAAVLAQQHPEEVHCSCVSGRNLLASVRHRPVSHKLLRQAPYHGVASHESGVDFACGNGEEEDSGSTTIIIHEHRPMQPKPLAKAKQGALEDEAHPCPRGREGTRFVVRQGDSTLESILQLDDVQGLSEMQRLVSEACDRLGVDMQHGFRMLLIDTVGAAATVGKSCTMERIRSASQIELIPKRRINDGKKAPLARRKPHMHEPVPPQCTKV